MAQAEDTELRDLVIEALERNGSLAKIRALLRANIFLAFEDECENMKQNINLDNILKLPEGILALSVIHEFLEFCCLKNTLFVYMSESRQGNEYNYEGKRLLMEKFNVPKSDAMKEPLLLTLIKSFSKLHHKKPFEPNSLNVKNHDKCGDKNYREEQNCTYILHDDSQSSTNSNSTSDNSSDEKNKLHLRLQLDNSDTDTSSDSGRDKSSSEYIPGDHILETNNNKGNIITQISSGQSHNIRNPNSFVLQDLPARNMSLLKNETKLTNSSSDSTSYIELKPFNSLDGKMLNTAGLPIVEEDAKSPVSSNVILETNMESEIPTPNTGTLSSTSASSFAKEKENKVESKKGQEPVKTDGEIGDFSYGDDFSSSPASKLKDVPLKEGAEQGDFEKSPNKNSSLESTHQTSQSSQSSVSLSDVADLLSEKSSLSKANNKNVSSSRNNFKEKVDVKSSNVYSDDSGDFSESPVASLSNLSLGIHSD